MRRTNQKQVFRAVLRDCIAAIVFGGGFWLLIYSLGGR